MFHNRFQAKKESVSQSLSHILSVLFGVGLLIMLVFAGNQVNASTAVEQQKHLEQAIRRSAVHCYATEGAYPQNLDYLKKYYGITYNENKYRVDYQVFASNVMPEITVIVRKPS